MADSKILEVDRDEWIYHSMKRYSNLYMFEMEFPANALEVIDDTSLCLSGLQAYSKKCEILQLSIPPKMLPKDIEEGLCKDRDFKIISGGYASNKILQLKLVKSTACFVAAVESGQNGVTIFKLGDENHAIVHEQTKLLLPNSVKLIKSEDNPGVIDTFSNRIMMGASDGKHLYEWTMDKNCSGSTSACLKHDLPSDFGGIVKMKFWDENSLAFLTDKGVVCLYDLRAGKPLQDGVIVYSTKSPLKPVEEDRQNLSIETKTSTSVIDDEPSARVVVNPIYSFDSIPSLHKIGIVDSYGGYESFDLRKVTEGKSPGHSSGDILHERGLLPGFERNSGIIGNRFNIEYEPMGREIGKENMNQFIVTGLREEYVQIFKEGKTSSQIETVFVHDGHCKTVSHALWHPNSERLVFSASADSMIHAWQYNLEGECE